MLVAHGIGVYEDFPIPVSLFAINGALVVLASFVVLVGFWERSRLRGDAAGKPLPRFAQSFVDSPVTRWVLRLVVLALALFVVAAGVFGSQSPASNFAPYAFFIQFWVGLVPLSLLFGAFWRYVNPLRALHLLWCKAAGIDPQHGFRRLPERWGLWPAAIALFAFVTYELAVPDNDVPSNVAIFIVVYALLQLVAAFVYGAEWFDRGDGFEVFSTLIGRVSPFGRRDDGVLVVRSPLNGIDGVTPRPGLVAFVVVLLGSTGFDGVTRLVWWRREIGEVPIWNFVGLVSVILAVGALYVLAARATGWVSGERHDWPRVLAHSLVPIALGYTIAHYFSLLLIDGQLTWILVSDPFGTGADWLGTRGNLMNEQVVSANATAFVRSSAIVLGHVLGTIAAHDRVLRVLPRGKHLWPQLPMLALMVWFTAGGLLLIVQ